MCQIRDWNERHRGVCHNLVGPLIKDVPDGHGRESVVSAAPPMSLRRPRSPPHERERLGTPHERIRRDYTDKAANKPAPLMERAVDKPAVTGSKEYRENGLERAVPSRAPASDRAPAAKIDRGGARSTRGRNFNPRDGDLRRPALAADSRSTVAQEGASIVYSGRGGGQRQRGRGGRNQPRHNHRATENGFHQGEDWDAINEKLQDSSKPKDPQPIQETKPKPVQETPKIPQQAPKIPQQTAQPAEVKKESPKPTPSFSVADATPTKKIVPKNYVIETLDIGTSVLLSLDAVTSDCRVASSGFVCLSMHDSVQRDYEALCEPYAAVCEQDSEPYTPTPGEAFSYFNTEESAWYRARCVAPSLAALVDSTRVVSVGPTDRCRRLSPAYQTQPEFSCVLLADDAAKLSVGLSLKATLVSKTPAGIKVSLEDLETAASLGEGEVSRWLPRVDYPAPVPKPKPADQSIPLVPRPAVRNNSRVLLVDATALDLVFVRPCDMAARRAFDSLLQDVAMYGLSAVPLKEPPLQGALVVSQFTDGQHYRALVRRTNVRQNKYQLEYTEFGNIHVNQLEKMYPCPPELDISTRPVVTSRVTIGDHTELTPQALEFIELLKDEAEMLLTLECASTTAPSGSAVTLTVMKANLNLNRRLRELCTPQWRLMEERGGDVLESEPMMYSSVEYVSLPPEGCEVVVLDATSLHSGTLNGHPKGLKHADFVFGPLTQQITEYCNSALGRDPYLPNDEELCIAKMPSTEQWCRAVKISQNGPGSKFASVLFMDYGTIVEDFPVSLLRKMLPEFIVELPAVAVTMLVKDFPLEPTSSQLSQAARHLQLDSAGRGSLTVTRCEPSEEEGIVVVHAPRLLAAIGVAAQ